MASRALFIFVLALSSACGGAAEGGPRQEPSSAGSAAASGAGEGRVELGAAPASSGSGGDAESGTSGGSASPTTSSEPKPEPVTFEGRDGQTCVCADSGSTWTDRLSLECYTSAINTCAPTLGPLAFAKDPSELSPFVLTRHDGCGRTTFSFNGGLAGSACTYDSASGTLVGASQWSDTAVDPCRTAEIIGGEADTCREGQLCSLSGGDTSCIDACSLASRNVAWSRDVDQPRLAEYRLVGSCEGEVASRHRLRRGCGRILVEHDGEISRFDAETQLLVGVSYPSQAGLTCDGIYGVPPGTCTNETSCSLCAGAADECTAEQLLGN